MRLRILQNAGDHTALILTGYRRVPAGGERRIYSALANHRGEVQQPLGEIRRPYVRNVEAGPVQDLLGEPVVTRRMAVRVAARRNLRHVDERLDAGFPRGLRELCCSLHQPWLNRIDEVRSIDVLQRCAY